MDAIYYTAFNHGAAVETLTVLRQGVLGGFSCGSFVQWGLGQGFVGPLIPRHAHGRIGHKLLSNPC
jgi:hypothetical protein